MESTDCNLFTSNTGEGNNTDSYRMTEEFIEILMKHI